MALDFHIAKSLEKAQTSGPEFRIELEEHKAFYNDFKEQAGSYFVLMEFQDYFSDLSLDPDGALLLLQDLDSYMANGNAAGYGSSFVSKLRQIAKKAIKQNKSIYVFCD